MKKLAYLLTLCTLLAACRNTQQNIVVKETYMHPFGVPITKSDWDSQGKTGKVVQLQKDGVTTTRSYANGILQGESTYTFPNSSTIHIVEVYDSGKLSIKRESFPSGVPMKEDVYESGELVELTRWYEDGTPAGVEIYQNGLIVSGEYRTPLNIVESRVQDGQGTRICRTNEGDLHYKDTIRNGSLVERVDFYPNGDPHRVTPYNNNLIHGIRLTYLQGGLPDTVEEWFRGKQEGITTVYLNGEKAQEITFKRGKKNGLECRFRDGKFLVEEIQWKNDQQHGPRKIYVDGDTKTEWFHQGEIVSRTTFERLNSAR